VIYFADPTRCNNNAHQLSCKAQHAARYADHSFRAHGDSSSPSCTSLAQKSRRADFCIRPACIEGLWDREHKDSLHRCICACRETMHTLSSSTSPVAPSIRRRSEQRNIARHRSPRHGRGKGGSYKEQAEHRKTFEAACLELRTLEQTATSVSHNTTMRATVCYTTFSAALHNAAECDLVNTLLAGSRPPH
jgi:hypothetical protein